MARSDVNIRVKAGNDINISPVGFDLNSFFGVPVINTTGGGAGGTLTYVPGYISTYEPVNSNTLLADDFSRGSWYAQDYDTASSNGTLNAIQNMGWGGTIYANPITPANAIVGGFVGLHGRQYAATSGYLDGHIGGRNMAEHNLLSSVTEAYFRIYFFVSSDYNGSHEKQFDFTRGIGNGLLALSYNYFGSGTVRVIPYLHQDDGLPPPAINAWMGPGGATITPGHWHYMEQHIRFNTPGVYNGTYEFWFDDCGPTGLSGPPTPTLRSSNNNVMFLGSGEAGITINGIWIENWANDGTRGSIGTIYYANVYVSKAFVGFANPAHKP